MKVAQVRVRHWDYVDSVEFVMADGTVKDAGYSSKGGIPSQPFKLDPDEHIVKIEAIQGDRLNGLRVFTSGGRKSEWFGRLFDGQGGRIVEVFAASPENPIVDVERNVLGSWGFSCPKIIRVQRLNDPPPDRTPQRLHTKPSEVSCPRHITSTHSRPSRRTRPSAPC